MFFTKLSSNKKFIFIFRLIVSLGVLLAIFWRIDFSLIWKRFSSIDTIGIISAGIILAADRVLMAYKWSILLKLKQICLTLWEATRLYFIGNLLGSFTPGNLGGDAYRLLALSTYKKNQVIISIFIIERMIGLLVIGLLALSFLPISLQYMGQFSWQAIWIISLGTVFVILISILVPRLSTNVYISNKIKYFFGDFIYSKINNFLSILTDFRRQWNSLVWFTLLTLLEIILNVLIHYVTARALNINISLFYLLCIVPIVQIMVRIPISFEGIGVQEGLLAYFYASGGFSTVDGVTVSIFLRILGCVIIYLPAGIMLLIYPFQLKHTLPAR